MDESDPQRPDGRKADAEGKVPTESKTSDASTNSGNEALISALQKVNLDVTKWLNHLQTECEVTKYGQLELLDHESAFKKLQKHANPDWEVNALRKLLGIGERYDVKHSEKAGKAKQQIEEARAFLAEMQSLAEEGKDRTDALVNRKEDQLRQALDIPDNAWIKASKDQSLDNVIGKFRCQLGELQQLETDRGNLSPNELLEKASGGLALTGVLLTIDNDDYGVKRRTVIKSPEGVVLKSPNSPQTDDVVELSSWKQSDSFSRTLDTMGRSTAVNLKGGYGLVQAEAGGSESHRDETQKDSEKHDTETYMSRLMYSFVPTAVCELRKSELKLCEDAIEELKQLEELIECTDDESVIKKKSEDILRKYGSHVNVANIEFGGVYIWQSTFYGKTSSKKEKLQAMVQDALSAHVSASYGIPLVGPSIGVATNREKTTGKTNVNASYEQTDVSRITTKTEKKGGPQEVSDLPLWKLGVLRYNNTWAVIDRGNKGDFVGIWELIYNDSTKFSNASRLVEVLQRAWHSLGGVGETDITMKFRDAKTTMDKMLQDVQGWHNDVSLSHTAVGHIKAMYEQIKHCNLDIEKLLATTLDNKTMSKFLEGVMNIKGEYSQSDLAELKGYMVKILDATGGYDFQLKDAISLWAKVEDNEGYHPDERITDIKDIPGLISVMKEVLLPKMQRAHDRENSASEGIDRQTTKDLSLAVLNLCELLDKRDLFFLCSGLLPLKYDSEKKNCQQLVTEENLQKSIEDLEKNWEKYHSFSDLGDLRCQAFLVHFLVSSIPKTETCEINEATYYKYMKIIEPMLLPELKSKLPVFSNSIVWKDLKRMLRSTMEGTSSEDQRGMELPDLRDILSQDPYSQRQMERPNCQHRPSSDAEELLNELGLAEYYPSKITLQDVMAVQVREYKTKQDLPNVPWLILKKLIMLDYKARESDLSHVVSTDKQNANEEPVESSKYDVFMDNFDSERKDDQSFNPLDVLVAIYACCDMALKQALLQKMFMCRLAVPFVSPLLSGSSLSYSLWALRSIIVDWKDSEGICKQTSVVDHPTKVVTFLKLGQCSSSKSNLLNHVISNQHHPTFWNRECPLGDSQMSVAKGLVEAQWYLPAGNQEDIFKDVTMFLNLRGDACEHKQQRKLIEKISTVVVCFLDITDLNKSKIQETMKSIHNNASKVVLFLTMKEPTQAHVKTQLEKYFTYVGDQHKHSTDLITSLKNGTQPRTTEDLKTQMRKTLCEYLECATVHSIDQRSSEAREEGMMIDEEDECCQEGKKLAWEVISSMGNMTTSTCKTNMLQLQGQYWNDWSKLRKERENAGGKGKKTIHETSSIDQKMAELRDKQLKVCENLSPLMKTFIGNMVKVGDSPVAVPYLHWLKIYLDDKSRETLPVMRHEYHKAWRNLKDAEKSDITKSKGKVRSSSIETLKEKLQIQERLLAEASLGVEHLFREMAQIYEAVVICNLASIKAIIDKLPALTAKMLLLGTPMEIMDGDAANVPLTWVKAVLKSLTKHIGEKRFLVTSVLGIQSSGKSTLLNTMFGLQFAVSAGRCTRGVYMQLIKVDKQRSNLQYDYIMVCDTEGLRAPELGQSKYNNDNQLATFVIGLGDVTILNIKGENAAEVSDILQIVVHAFLKMSQSKNNFTTHRTCFFIHQNVPAINAKSQMDQGTKVLQEKLDVMTKEVCTMENIMDINSFSQVIDFDSDRNVWYFSDLWHGSPPMAPVNRGYTRNVQDVRDDLLSRFTEKEQSFLTISDKSTHVEDLWKGVLAQDFVFSFKNSLAAKAYHSLEKKYNEITWDVSCKISEWFNTVATVAIDRCRTKGSLVNQNNQLCTELARKGRELQGEACPALDKFFEAQDLKDVLVQWKSQKQKGLESAIDNYIETSKKEIQQKIEDCKAHLVQKERFNNIEGDIMQKARHLANSLKGQQADDEEIQRRFEEFWINTVSELLPQNEKKQVAIGATIEDLLFKWLPNDKATLREELQSGSLSLHPKINKLKHSLGSVDGNQLSIETGVFKKIGDALLGTDRRVKCAGVALDTINKILESVDSLLAEICNKEKDFQENLAESVIKTLVEGIDTSNAILKTQHHFTLLPTLKVKVVVHVYHHVVKLFTQMREKYQQKHDVLKQLEQKKQVNLTLFKNMVNQCTNEFIAADLLLGHLEILVKHEVQKAMTLEVKNEVVHYFGITKYYLLTKILGELADSSFEQCMKYVRNPKQFALEWITSFINKLMFSVKDKKKISRFIELVQNHTNKYEQIIKEKIKAITDSFRQSDHVDIKMWIKKFTIIMTELPVTEHTLKSVMDHNVKDFENLQTLLFQKLPAMQNRILDDFKQKTADTQKWGDENSYEQILDRLWGCEAQCPFCREVCQRTDPNHLSPNDSHQCIQHRPSGVAGAHFATNKVLRIESCNFDIQSDRTFSYAGLPECKASASCVEGEYYPYRQYKRFLPDWDIAPSPNMDSSNYWMWFISKYKHKLAAHYKTKVPEIPDAWEKIPKQKAIDSLRECLS